MLDFALKMLLPRDVAPVLLYHATFAEPPPSIRSGLHNVTPGNMRRQLQMLLRSGRKARFLDDLIREAAQNSFAVTFDDAYLSVFAEALPVLEEMQIPATVYVNSGTLEGKVFWRDKLRLVLNSGREQDFLAHLHALGLRLPPGSLYKASKSPLVHSRLVDEALDGFLGPAGIAQVPRLCAASLQDLPRHPLLRYGNHTRHHYVLASLSAAEQEEEIRHARDLLAGADLALCPWLSVPFGGQADSNADTARIAAELGYQGLLFSRDRLHKTVSGARSVERCMADPDWPALRRHLLALRWQGRLGQP